MTASSSADTEPDAAQQPVAEAPAWFREREALRRTPVAPPLEQVIANRRWVRSSRPFRHMVATDVFTPEFYGSLDQQFRDLLAARPDSFQLGIPNYDAGAFDVGAVRTGPLGVFLSRAWHDMLAQLTGVPATGDVVATLHHHGPGSRRGWPHNDLSPGFFGGRAPGPDEIRTETDTSVSYQHGTSPTGERARITVRAVSVLFYLANGPWRPGDGGETGLFARAQDPQPTVVVPPIDNSLVLFECTPHSLHTFLGTSKPRNCVVMWLHRRKRDAVGRWGEQSIVHW